MFDLKQRCIEESETASNISKWANVYRQSGNIERAKIYQEIAAFHYRHAARYRTAHQLFTVEQA